MITHVKHNVCIVISSTLRHENSRCTFHMHQMIHKLRHKINKYLNLQVFKPGYYSDYRLTGKLDVARVNIYFLAQNSFYYNCLTLLISIHIQMKAGGLIRKNPFL